MSLTSIESLAIIALAGIITYGSRRMPFFFFSDGRAPQIIIYLGKVLPSAMMALLIVYSLKDTNLSSFPYGLYEVIAVISVVALHRWKSNSLLSIFGGTAIYMLLVQQF